ncbi:hypothetical protein OPT61_g4464 [Boeremia exigua]|uniref:Uncharacterized protein n=1 Tax=Boeremia exigua TaxID=749465 RepID=A0ACC2IE14_9PLEO|nr:hypothetical protein OPT61_g4464 [Boeremia exigua]
MSLSELPPIVACQFTSLRDHYARASGNPQQRMSIITEFAQRFPLSEDDLLALAVEEAKLFYRWPLPQGVYRNTKGQTFDIDDYGKLSKIKENETPAPNHVWVPAHHREATGPVPQDYLFIVGGWQMASFTHFPTTTPVQAIPAPVRAVPADLAGATLRGVMPPMPPQFQPVPQNCSPADFGSQQDILLRTQLQQWLDSH